MPYVPTNLQVYGVGLSGALSGMAISGWITSNLASDYTQAAAIAGAFAEALDTAWADANPLNPYQYSALSDGAQQLFSSRNPGTQTSPLTTSDNWTSAARALARATLQGTAYMASQGIAAPQWSGANTSFTPTLVDWDTPPPATVEDALDVLALTGRGVLKTVALANGLASPQSIDISGAFSPVKSGLYLAFFQLYCGLSAGGQLVFTPRVDAADQAGLLVGGNLSAAGLLTLSSNSLLTLVKTSTHTVGGTLTWTGVGTTQATPRLSCLLYEL